MSALTACPARGKITLRLEPVEAVPYTWDPVLFVWLDSCGQVSHMLRRSGVEISLDRSYAKGQFTEPDGWIPVPDVEEV